MGPCNPGYINVEGDQFSILKAYKEEGSDEEKTTVLLSEAYDKIYNCRVYYNISPFDKSPKPSNTCIAFSTDKDEENKTPITICSQLKEENAVFTIKRLQRTLVERCLKIKNPKVWKDINCDPPEKKDKD